MGVSGHGLRVTQHYICRIEDQRIFETGIYNMFTTFLIYKIIIF